MAAGYLELFLEQGEDFSADITIDSLNGSPYDLSNFTVKSQIRKSHWSDNTTASFDASISANGQNGIITLSLDSSITENVSSGRYVYDVFLTNSSNNRSKVLEGILFVDPSSTKI
jgi:hypothetical protein